MNSVTVLICSDIPQLRETFKETSWVTIGFAEDVCFVELIGLARPASARRCRAVLRFPSRDPAGSCVGVMRHRKLPSSEALTIEDHDGS